MGVGEQLGDVRVYVDGIAIYTLYFSFMWLVSYLADALSPVNHRFLLCGITAARLCVVKKMTRDPSLIKKKEDVHFN